MATTNVKTFAELLSEVKTEARVKGSDNLDDWIKTLINELLTSAVENRRYMEMLVLNQEITTLNAVSQYALPDDFLVMKAIKYRRVSSSYTLFDRNHYAEIAAGSNPRYYEIAGNSLVVTPFENIPNDDTLVFDYYKYPTKLVGDADVFPVPKLYASVKQKAVARAYVYNNNLKQAAILNQEGESNSARGHTVTS